MQTATNTILSFQLETEFIQVNNLLKLTGCVLSSGEGKDVVRFGRVHVNGVVISEMRKKIYKNDIVLFDAVTIQVI